MGFKNFLEFFQFKDEDDDFDDDDEDDEIIEERRLTKRGEKVEPAKPVQRQPVTSSVTRTSTPASKPTYHNDPSQKPSRVERTSNKVVPMKNNARGFEVCIMKPTQFSDAQDICDILMKGQAAVVNLEGFDPVEAQRIMDFVSGCIYTMNGRFHQISRYIFIFSPESVDISGDYQDYLNEGNFGVPTINKDF